MLHEVGVALGDGATDGAPCPANGADAPSFADQMRGRDPRGIDLVLAHLAKDVYPDASSPVDGWEPLTSEELDAFGIDPHRLRDPLTGFSAAIYSSRSGGRVLAFAGTDEPIDWIENVLQGTGQGGAQYARAVALARDARAAFGDSLAITGHSLGGGLASVAALATGVPAVTFNAAGPHPVTIIAAGVNPFTYRSTARDLIRRYTVDHEALTWAQEDGELDLLLWDGVGHRIRLAAPRELPTEDVLDYRIEMHGMDAVLEAMQGDPWETRPADDCETVTDDSPVEYEHYPSFDCGHPGVNVPAFEAMGFTLISTEYRECGLQLKYRSGAAGSRGSGSGNLQVDVGWTLSYGNDWDDLIRETPFCDDFDDWDCIHLSRGHMATHLNLYVNSGPCLPENEGHPLFDIGDLHVVTWGETHPAMSDDGTWVLHVLMNGGYNETVAPCADTANRAAEVFPEFVSAATALLQGVTVADGEYEVP